jgi:6-phosphogluconolactonase
MNSYQLLKFATDVELAKAAALAWLEKISEARKNNKSHLVALSGGRIAKHLFNIMVEQVRQEAIGIEHVEFFWADERCVPPDDPESNFITANELLFKPLKVAEANIHRLRGELDQRTAVTEAIADLSRRAPYDASGQPVLDLILLGMGEDGHIASLFPDAGPEVLNCSAPVLAISDSPKPPPKRLSLSYAAIAAAKEVWVLASGKGKESALKESLSPTGKTPLANVLKSRSQAKIFFDITIE